ncbi:MAG: hypothetical protein KF760_03400 [Candidatus Eremiobacteraeota bacterium]|nr:hypothetical protein [Candidatus Eremiobacteraeota bacterium]MCW5872030.1 hypothetical protein [Candidatus Eremiobacteraeota bacterium]
MRCLLLFLALLTPPLLAQPLELVPAPEEKVQEDRPCIQVSWPEGAVQAQKCRLWMNGREVTGECLRSGRFLSYRPYKAPAAGTVEVRFQAEDPMGQPLEKSWKFLLAPGAWIQNLSHDARSDLFEDDTLQVQFRAPSRGKASFTLGNLGPVEMSEKEPGLYQGSYRVKSSDTSLNQPLTAHYQKGDHQEVAVAHPPVKVFGGFYRVRITSPADGSLVEQNFVLTGHARPGSRVSVIPKIGFSDDIPSPTTNSNAVAGTAGSIPAEVDEQGDFQVEYGMPILLPGMQVVMSIFAVDAEGNRSMPTIVRYRFK